MPHDHRIDTEPVNEILALRPGLVKIVVSRTNVITGEVARFALPIQWQPREAGELIQQIRGLAWQLADDDNLPIDYGDIKALFEGYIYQKVGFIEPISVKWRSKK